MDAIKIRQIAGKCEQISEFIRQLDSYTHIEIAAKNLVANVSTSMSTDLVRDIWPDFRELLVAKYNELAATINADKFFDSKSTEFTDDDAYHSLTGE